MWPGDRIRYKTEGDEYEVAGVGEGGWYVAIRDSRGDLDHIYKPGADNWEVVEKVEIPWMKEKGMKRS